MCACWGEGEGPRMTGGPARHTPAAFVWGIHRDRSQDPHLFSLCQDQPVGDPGTHRHSGNLGGQDSDFQLLLT